MEVNQSLSKIIFGMVDTCLNLVKEVTNLAYVEAQLAGKSVAHISILLMGLFLFLLTAWFGACGIILSSLIFYGTSWMFAISLVTVLNIAGALITSVFIFRIKNNFLFEATKRQLENLGKSDKGYFRG